PSGFDRVLVPFEFRFAGCHLERGLAVVDWAVFARSLSACELLARDVVIRLRSLSVALTLNEDRNPLIAPVAKLLRPRPLAELAWLAFDFTDGGGFGDQDASPEMIPDS